MGGGFEKGEGWQPGEKVLMALEPVYSLGVQG